MEAGRAVDPPPAPTPLFDPPVLTPARPAPHDLWKRALDHARANRRLAAILDESRLEGVENDLVVLSMEPGWAAMARERLQAIEALFSAAAGSTMRVEIRERGSPTPAALVPLAAPESPPQDPATHPLVREAIEKLRAKVVAIQPRKTARPAEPPAP